MPLLFFFSSRRRHTRLQGDWSSDVCSSDLQDPADLAAAALPARKDMFIAVVRTDEVLTGLLIGAAVLHVACAAVVLGGGGPAGLVLVGVVAVVNLLRARLFVTLRHRLPLLIAGLAAAAILG